MIQLDSVLPPTAWAAPLLQPSERAVPRSHRL